MFTPTYFCTLNIHVHTYINISIGSLFKCHCQRSLPGPAYVVTITHLCSFTFYPSCLTLFFLMTPSPSAYYKTYYVFTICSSYRGVAPGRGAIYFHIGHCCTWNRGWTWRGSANNHRGQKHGGCLFGTGHSAGRSTHGNSCSYLIFWRKVMALAHFLLLLEVTFIEVKKLSQAGGFKPCLPAHPATWPLCFFLGLFPEVADWAPAFAKGLVSSLLPENATFRRHVSFARVTSFVEEVRWATSSWGLIHLWLFELL